MATNINDTCCILTSKKFSLLGIQDKKDIYITASGYEYPQQILHSLYTKINFFRCSLYIAISKKIY